jgi:hypothetical protein
MPQTFENWRDFTDELRRYLIALGHSVPRSLNAHALSHVLFHGGSQIAVARVGE